MYESARVEGRVLADETEETGMDTNRKRPLWVVLIMKSNLLSQPTGDSRNGWRNICIFVHHSKCVAERAFTDAMLLYVEGIDSTVDAAAEETEDAGLEEVSALLRGGVEVRRSEDTNEEVATEDVWIEIGLWG